MLRLECFRGFFWKLVSELIGLPESLMLFDEMGSLVFEVFPDGGTAVYVVVLLLFSFLLKEQEVA